MHASKASKNKPNCFMCAKLANYVMQKKWGIAGFNAMPQKTSYENYDFLAFKQLHVNHDRSNTYTITPVI